MLQLLRTAHAGCADVDACNSSLRPAQGVLCGLRCPAAGDQYRSIFPIRTGRPQEMIIRSTSLPVFPKASIFFKAVNRLRVRITVVEVSDLVLHCRQRRRFCLLAHSTEWAA